MEAPKSALSNPESPEPYDTERDPIPVDTSQEAQPISVEEGGFVADGIKPHGAARTGDPMCDLDEGIQRILIGTVAGKARGKLLHLGDLAFQRLTMGEQKSLDLLSRRDS